MKNKFFNYLVIILCLSGCSITGYYGSSEVRTSKEETVAKLKAQNFVGRTKDDVLNYYGKPQGIRFNVGHHDAHLGHPNSYTTYDEMWYYKYEAGIPLLFPDQYAIKFYFIGDIVRLVTG